MTDTCSICTYGQTFVVNNLATGAVGTVQPQRLCRKPNPSLIDGAVIVYNSTMTGNWVTVRDDDWCGDFMVATALGTSQAPKRAAGSSSRRVPSSPAPVESASND